MSARPKVVIPGDCPRLVSLSPCLSGLYDIAEVELYLDRPSTDEVKVRRLKDADVLLNSKGSLKWPDIVLRQLPKLKMIAVCGIGFDAIDLAQATAQGIVVCNIPGRTAVVVAEHTIALIMSVARRLAWTTRELKAGSWPGQLGISLPGRQLGVIGTGNIGCEVIRMAKALGMNVVAWTVNPDPSKADRLGFHYVPLENLLQSSDIISLHTRLSDQTRELIGPNQLKMMKPSSILINTSRGAVVNMLALVASLQSGHLFGAGLDVFDQEPLPADHPILDCDNVVLTPHNADYTQEGLDAMTQGCIDNIAAWLAGCPQNVVNRDVLVSR
jgi:D-3-phosphoglycerate dehydrogenase